MDSNWFASEDFWLGRKERMGEPVERSITVIIPAYNEAKSIAKTLNSVKAQEGVFISRVVVVDDCSSDNTGEIARSMGADVIRPKTNSGTKALALNLAIPTVTTELMICIDGDTELSPRAVYDTLKYFNDPQTGVVTGFVVPQYANTFWEKGRLLEYLYVFSVVKAAQEHIKSVLIASGCFMVMRTNLVLELGSFSDDTMGEDLDLTWRIIEAGYKVRLSDTSLCRVVDPADRETFHKQVSRWIHGFIQNLRVRKYNLFRHNKMLGTMAYFYLFWSVLGPVIFVTSVAWLAPSVWLFVLAFITYNTLFVWIPATVAGLKRGFGFWTIVSSFVPSFLLQYYNAYIIFETLFKEFVMRRTLSVWHKGH